MRNRARRAAAAGAIALALATSCTENRFGVGDEVAGGDPERGRAAIARYGCGSCHRIPGVPGAEGSVGPPLDGISGRTYIAGRLTNTADHLVVWIRDPKTVDERTAMPDLGVNDQDARDIASYLYSLQ
jgi:cytochrome c2